MPTSPVMDRGERVPQPRGLLSKKCRYCERRFSKAEHLKRHQRSHTGERPYTCPRCQKSFSRSDVLIRHLKNHPQIVGEEVEKSSSEGETIEVNGVASNGVQVSPRGAAAPTPQAQRRISMIDPALEPPSLQGHEEHPHSFPSGLDHLALLASSRQNWGNGGNMDAVMTNANHHGLPSISQPQNWNMEMAAAHHASQIDPNLDPRLAQPETEFRPMERSTVNTPRFSFGGDLYSERLGGMPGQITPGMGELSADVSIMPQDLQTWFDQFELDSQLPAANLPNYENANGATRHPERRGSSLAASETHSLRNPSSPSTLIPNERFAKVERCWPNRQSNPLRLMPTLWADVAMKPEDNLFSNGNLSPEAMEQNRQCGSRWGLDEDCRERLQRMFVSMNTVVGDQTAAAFGSPDNFSSPSDTRSTHGPTVSVIVDPPSNFPPAEIFDIGLDLYFRQFHPLQPFIHTATFCPKTAPTSLLFTMCLIGLTILQTKGATAFVKQTFSKALEQVSNELNPGLLHEGRRIDQLFSLASAILLLNLSEMTGSHIHQSQCQMLYTNLITTAQRHGLFNQSESPPLNDAFFAQIPDLEARWKAWARIECVKRLIIALTMVDTWYSGMLHTSPIMSTNNIQVILPCDSTLFSAPTAQKWSQLGSTMTHPQCMPTFTLTSTSTSLPQLAATVEPLAVVGILSILRLRISAHFHRLLSGHQTRAAAQSFIPALTFSLDPSASNTPNLVVSILTNYSNLFHTINPNCLVLWHNMNIMLCADIRLFETGAGCAGAEAAHQALDDIAVWTATPSARRACLHAAQTFKLMSNRRASDGDPFHASSSLFLSALILGLYVFMSNPSPDQTPDTGFDLADDVDWVAVGLTGLVSEEGSGRENQGGDDPASKFIREGGSICFDGVVHRPGYEAARRILLDYARLLEDIGRWRARVGMFSKVLRIMSDALVDVEMGGQ